MNPHELSLLLLLLKPECCIPVKRSAGEYPFSYPSFHMICLHQDRPMPVEQVRNGRTFNHMMTRGNVQIVPAGTENIWRHQEGSHHMHVLLAPEVLQHVAEENSHHHRTELLDLNSMQDPRIEHISTASLPLFRS